MGVEVEGAGDQYVEAGVHRFAGGRDDVLTADRAVFRADEDRGPTLGAVLAFEEGGAGADEIARPGRHALEDDAIALGLLFDALGLEIVDDDGREILSRSSASAGERRPPAASISSISSSSLAGARGGGTGSRP